MQKEITVDYTIEFNANTGKVNKNIMMKVAKDLIFNQKKVGDYFVKDNTNREFAFSLAKDGNEVTVDCEFTTDETECGKDRYNVVKFYYSPKSKKIEDVEYESYFVESFERKDGKITESVTRKMKESEDTLHDRMADFLLSYADYYDLNDAMDTDEYDTVEDWVYSLDIDELAEGIRFDLEDENNGALHPSVVGDDTVWFGDTERYLSAVRDEGFELLAEYGEDYDSDHFVDDSWDSEKIDDVNVKFDPEEEAESLYDLEF